MRITVARSGGLAGLHRERTLDTGVLPADERDAVERLVDDARVFEAPERATSGLPDVIRWRVTVADGDRVRVLATDEIAAPAPLAELARRVLGEAP